jgi:hypothetical protein
MNDFLSEVSSVPLQQGLRHLQTAFTNWLEMDRKQDNGTLGKNMLNIKVKTLYNQEHRQNVKIFVGLGN